MRARISHTRPQRKGFLTWSGKFRIKAKTLAGKYMKSLALALIFSVGILALPGGRREFVPVQAGAYRARLIREAHAAGGLGAPVEIFAAQIHQESGWKETAQSGVGAIGLCQFMPGTAQWIANLYPTDLKPGAPLDPDWAIRALVRYDYWLSGKLAQFKEGDDRWAAALASYNGGLGWVQKEAKLARADGICNSHCKLQLEWWYCVARFNARSQSSWTENRGYPERILHLLRPLYLAAGWH
jgi:soluble lytic murein transglycosylase-like protein